MSRSTIHHSQAGQRQRGSVYILVLAASLLVATIGISSLMAARISLRSTTSTEGMVESRELARTAIDRALWEVKNNSAGWRLIFHADILSDVSFGNGTFSLMPVDPVDSDLLDDPTDPVFLVGVGQSGNSQYMIAVMMNSDGTLQPKTWRHIVDYDD